MENTLLTEIMVLREKNAELVEMLHLCVQILKVSDVEESMIETWSNAIMNGEQLIESLINSNITE